MATTDYRILVDTSQAIASINNLTSKMSQVGTTVSQMNGNFNKLAGVTNAISAGFQAVVGGAVLAGFAQLSDSVTSINNKLITASNGTADTAKQFAALAAIAIETRSSFEGVAAVYSKMMMASKTLGISQKDAAQYTMTLSKALALTGATTAETNSVLLQFSQGLSAGVFQGDELRAIMEGNIIIVQALADTMGKSTTEIKQLGSEGKITADVMLKALKGSADEIAAAFAKMKPTIAQAFEELHTSSMVAMDVFENQTATGEKFARSIEYIAMKLSDFVKWIDDISGKLRVVGEVLAVLLGFTVVGKIFEGVALAGSALLTIINSIAGVFTGFGGIVREVVFTIRGLIFGFTDATGASISTSKVLTNIGFELTRLTSKFAISAKAVGGFVGAIAAFFGFQDVAKWFNSLGDATSETRQELENFRETSAKTAIESLSDAKTKGTGVIQQSKQVTEQISRETAALNKLVAAYKDSTQAAMSKFRVDTDTIGMSERDKLAVQEQTAAFDAYKSKIDEVRADIAAKKATGSESDLAMIPKLEQALNDLTAAYNTQAGAIGGLVEERLKAESANAVQLFSIKEQIDANNKLQSIYDDMAKNTMSELEKKYYDIEAAARDSAKAQIQSREAALGPGQKLGADEINKINQAAYAGVQAQKDLATTAYQQSRTFEAGWAKAFKSYRDNATNAATQAEKIFQNVTQGLEDMIVKFTKTGKLNWQDFVNSLVETLLRSQIQQLMANIFGGLGSGKATGGTGGGSLLGGIGSLLGFANGGTIPTNGPVLVGERGPELLFGAAGGNVVPNGGANVTYNINAVDAMSFKQMLAKDPSFLYAVSEQGRRKLPGGR